MHKLQSQSPKKSYMENCPFATWKPSTKFFQPWDLEACRSIRTHEVSLFSERFRWAGRRLLVASEEPKSGAVKSDEVECFLSLHATGSTHTAWILRHATLWRSALTTLTRSLCGSVGKKTILKRWWGKHFYRAPVFCNPVLFSAPGFPSWQQI